MCTILAMLNKVKSLDIPVEAINIIKLTQDQLIQKNKDQLFKQGVNKQGFQLQPTYRSAFYAQKKYQLNPSPGLSHPDLKLTGDFYNGFYLATTQNSFEIGSTDSKESTLEDIYGKDIFGITQQNLTDYSLNIFYPYLKSYITLKTGLKFV